MTVKEKRQKRMGLVKEARHILDTAEKEKRALSAEDEKRYDEIMKEVDSLFSEIEKEERVKALEAELAGSQHEPIKPDPESRGGESGEKAEKEKRDAEVRAFRHFLSEGRSALSGDERRALSAGDGASGGFLVAPQQFVAELIKGLDNDVFMRNIGHVLPPLTTNESLGAPSLDADISDADWTSEILTGTEDSSLKFGKRELHPHPLAKRIKVSRTLIRKSSLPAENIVNERLRYKFGITQEKGFMTGSGSNQPLGIFTASNDGIPTSRDLSTDMTSTSITADGLVNVKYNQKGGYWKRGRWIFHRDAIKQIRKLKDSNNQYVWAPGLSNGQPDRILESPFVVSEYCPNTFTTGQYVGMFGDFSFYWIVDVLSMEVQRLTELYAEANQIGFIGRLETDGMPVLAEAFTRIKLA